jgi:hypothetical protein
MLDNLLNTSGMSRRSLMIGGGLGLAALPALAPSAADAAFVNVSEPSFDSPAAMLDLYIKMSGDTSGKNYGGWYSGHAFAVRPGEMITPLFGFTGFGLGSDRRQPDGNFHHLWKEIGFYTDLKTGEVLETWKNPLNGETCDVMPIHNRSVNLTFAQHLPDPAPMKKVGVQLMDGNFAKADDPTRPYGVPYAVIGDQISVFSDSVGQVPNQLDPAIWKRESTGGKISVGEFFMLTGSLRQALDPAVTRVDATGSWTRVGPYLPWMLMGPSEGHLLYRSATRKISGPEALPKDLVAYTHSRYPTFLEFPDDWSTPIESSWEVFKREYKPRA